MAAAFDGPLRQGFDIIGRYRTAERMLTRRLRPLIGKPGSPARPSASFSTTMLTNVSAMWAPTQTCWTHGMAYPFIEQR